MISRAPRSRAQEKLTGAKMAFAVVGLLIWAYGLRTDDTALRWLGIVFLLAAFLLRFLRRWRQADE